MNWECVTYDSILIVALLLWECWLGRTKKVPDDVASTLDLVGMLIKAILRRRQ